jgi:CBS domain-containing protein
MRELQPQGGVAPPKTFLAAQLEAAMKVREAMTSEVYLTRPDEPIREAARTMASVDFGALPVRDDERLIGMITDRDIAVRGVAEGKGPDTPVREVMSTDICYCFDDQELDEVAANMADIKVRRLPVVDRNKRLVGIVSLGDIALADDPNQAASTALCGVSEPGGLHSQGDGRA